MVSALGIVPTIWGIDFTFGYLDPCKGSGVVGPETVMAKRSLHRICVRV